MTKIYEALQQASKARVQPPEESVVPSMRASIGNEVDATLLAAYQRIETLVEEGRCPVIAFVGVPNGDDCSRFVAALGKTASRCLNKNVLLLSAEGRAGGGFSYPGPSRGSGAEGQTAGNGADPAASVTKEPVFLTKGLRTMDVGMLTAPDVRTARSQMAPWREAFDLVLIDASRESSGAREDFLCAAADGVVMVVEAERARWQAVKHRMDQIALQHGRVLGVILNKQRRYIPDAVYKML